MDQDGIGWGYPFTEKEIKKLRLMASNDKEEEELLEELPRSYDYLEVAKQAKTFKSLVMQNYYDLGDYASNRSLTNVAYNVMPTIQAEIYKIGDNTITVWIIDDLSREDGNQRQAIVYSINGAPSRILDDDNLGDTEFALGENKKGELVIVWASSTGLTNTENATALEKYKMLNNSMEIKTATIDLKTGRVSDIVKIQNTDDQRQDTLPKFTSRENVNIITFVKDEKTKYDANVKPGYTEPVDDETQKELAENFNKIQNAIQTGVHKNYYSIDIGNGYSEAIEIPINIPESLWRAGTKITSNDIAFLDDNTVLYAFTVEIPNAQKGSFTGVERALFVQKGILKSDGLIDFSEGAVCVDRIFDYDAPLSEVFPEGNIPEEYLDRIEDTKTGVSVNEDPLISDVQFERIGLPDGFKGVSDKLTLFYRNKTKLMSINEANLIKATDLKSTEPVVLTTVMTLMTNEYDLNVSEGGNLYIVYSGGTELNDYDTALFMRIYDSSTSTWSKPKRSHTTIAITGCFG